MSVRGRTAGNAGQGAKWCHPPTRRRIYARDGWKCMWCGCALYTVTRKGYEGPHVGLMGSGTPLERATLDHVIPRSRGGTNRTHNLITSCVACNRDRGNLDADSFAISRAGSSGPTLMRIIAAVCAPLPATK